MALSKSQQQSFIGQATGAVLISIGAHHYLVSSLSDHYDVADPDEAPAKLAGARGAHQSDVWRRVVLLNPLHNETKITRLI